MSYPIRTILLWTMKSRILCRMFCCFCWNISGKVGRIGTSARIWASTTPQAGNPRIPVVPDGFLSLGVDRRKGGKARRSYVLWEEQSVPPILTLEMVSHSPGGEYDEKRLIYAQLGVLYYVIYNPEFWRRDRHSPFEVYKLIAGTYQLQQGEPFWMPEVGLGIGRCELPSDPLRREVLSWYDSQGDRCLTEAEVAQQREIAAQRTFGAAVRADCGN